ncbi:hypothetical protein KDI_00480 [Dictyobacter arantiisoli]|uniref:Uncharacterized protein n=1 Tax=Dictyobacter arantiisoli TaxID=2014874 RepID=A0A5A5T652_9CHLR|nr:hypothetical protein KDI_00480 [Dictyobacter arantiisoli]
MEGHDPLALALLPACSGAALGRNGHSPPPVKGGSYGCIGVPHAPSFHSFVGVGAAAVRTYSILRD